MVAELIHVDSPNVSYDGDQIAVNYEYSTTNVKKIDNRMVVSGIIVVGVESCKLYTQTMFFFYRFFFLCDCVNAVFLFFCYRP